MAPISVTKVKMNEKNRNKLLQYGRELLELELYEAQKLPDRLGDDFIKACELILSIKGKVIVSGIGKSGHIGKKIAASLASTGTPSFFMHPSEALHGDLGMVTADDIVILISYSGRAKEFNLILPQLKEMKVPVIAITGGLNSPLASAAQSVLDISVEKEACPMGTVNLTDVTQKNIIENPYQLVIVPIEAPQTPRSLDSAILSVVNGNYAIGAGLDLAKALYTETLDKNYKNVIAIRTNSIDTLGNDIIDVLKSQQFNQVIDDKNGIFYTFQQPDYQLY